jgi:hypothetical protein
VFYVPLQRLMQGSELGRRVETLPSVRSRSANTLSIAARMRSSPPGRAEAQTRIVAARGLS